MSAYEYANGVASQSIEFRMRILATQQCIQGSGSVVSRRRAGVEAGAARFVGRVDIVPRYINDKVRITAVIPKRNVTTIIDTRAWTSFVCGAAAYWDISGIRCLHASGPVKYGCRGLRVSSVPDSRVARGTGYRCHTDACVNRSGTL